MALIPRIQTLAAAIARIIDINRTVHLDLYNRLISDKAHALDEELKTTVPPKKPRTL